MEDIKRNILNKAVAMLRATGCQFAVITPEGEKLGELTVVPPKQKITRTFTGIKYKPLYEERVAKIEPGEEIHEFSPPAGMELEPFRGSLASHCSRLWGKESHSTQIRDGKVLLMRWS